MAAPIAYFLAALVRRRQSAYAYALVLYSTFLGHPVVVAGLSLSVYLTALIVVVEALRFVGGRSRIASIRTIDVLAVLLLCWWLLSLTYHEATDISALRPPIVVCLILLATKFRPHFDASDFRILSFALMCGGLLVATACIIQAQYSPSLYGVLRDVAALDSTPVPDVRPTGLQGNPNAASLYLIFGYCATLSHITSQRSSRRVLRLILAIGLLSLIVWALYLCQSRSAILGLVLASTLASRSFRIPTWLLVFVSFLVGGVMSLKPQLLLDVISAVFSRRDAPTDLGREQLWAGVLESVLRSPLLGEPSVVYTRDRPNVHNDFFSQAMNAGLPAGFLFTGLLFVPLVSFLRLSRAHPQSPHAGLVLWICIAATVHGMFHQVLQSGICFWMLIGLATNNTDLQRRVSLQRSNVNNPANDPSLAPISATSSI